MEAPTLDQDLTDRQEAQVRSQEPSSARELRIPGYQLTTLLGTGSFGQVWGGLSQRTGLEVAVKVFNQGSAVNWTYLRQEADRLGKVAEHPHVVSLLDADFDHDPPYFVMRRYQGSLHEWRQKTPQPGLARLLRWWREIAEALRYTHSKGLLHCDLKPSNLLLDEEERALLSDFGQAAVGRERGGSHLGSLGFMAPEQASQLEEGQTSPDVLWDIYSLGASFYYLLSKRLPRLSQAHMQELGSVAGTAEKLSRYRRSLQENALIPIGRFCPDLHPDLASLLESCLELDPRRRPQSAADLLEDFQRSREHKPLLCRRPWSRGYQLTRLGRRYAAPLLLAGGLALAGTGLAAQRYFGQQAIQAASDLERGLNALNEGRKLAAAHWLVRSLALRPAQPSPLWLLQEDPAHLQFYQQTPSPLVSVGFSQDGNLLYAAGEDGAQIYDLRTGQSRGLRLGTGQARPNQDSYGYRALPPAAVNAGINRILLLTSQTACYDLVSGEKLSRDLPAAYQAQMSADGSRGVMLTPAGAYQIDSSSDGGLQTRKLPLDDVSLAAISPDGARLFLADRQGRVWQMTGQSPHLLLEMGRAPDALAVSPDQRWLVVSAENKPFCFYNLAENQRFQLADSHYAVTGTNFSPDGGYVALSCWNGVTQLFQLSNPQKAPVLLQHKWLTYNTAFSPDSRFVATFALDGMARVYETATGRAVSPWLEHSSPVKSVAFRPGPGLDGALDLATACEDGSLRVFRLNLRNLPLALDEGGRGYQVEYSPDGSRLAVACQHLNHDGWLELWWQGRRQVHLPLPGQPALLSWSPDGSGLAVSAGNSVALVSSDGRLDKLLAVGAEVTALEYSSQGLLLVGDAGGRLHLYQAGQEKRSWSGQAAGRISLAHFSPDGQRIVSASARRVQIWDLQGQPQSEVVLGDLVRQAIFAPDGQRMAVACLDKTAQIYSLGASLKPELNPPVRHELGICEVAFSPDGRLLATASVDGLARLWDSQSGTPQISGLRHSAPISRLRFSPDGSKLVTCTKRGTAYVWGLDGRPLLSPIEHGDFIYGAAFRPDSGQLTTSSVDGSLQQRDLQAPEKLSLDELRRRVEQRTGLRIQVEGGVCLVRPIPPAEWKDL
ncbi:MAG: serine/threonine-protein kinase [Vulcanimicrobiota bacterium]